jgi:hypothetical protein
MMSGGDANNKKKLTSAREFAEELARLKKKRVAKRGAGIAVGAQPPHFSGFVSVCLKKFTLLV